MKRIVCWAMVVAVGMWVVPALAAGPDGKALYQKKMCSACHGAGGEGKVGPALKGYSKTAKECADTLKKGGVKMKPVLGTDEELAAICGYLATLK